MYKQIRYLNHLLTATNQYGVHSPFVYDYLTKCLYTKQKFKASKSENVVLKSIPYFSVEKFKIDAEASRIENQIQNELRLKASNDPPFDLIYLDNPMENMLSIHRDKIHNNSMVLIKDIHRTKGTTSIWKALKQDPKVTVSIDMFYCAVLFFRKEQVKEHFKIRI